MGLRGSIVLLLAFAAKLGAGGCSPVLPGGHRSARWQLDDGQPKRNDPTLRHLIALRHHVQVEQSRVEGLLLQASRRNPSAARQRQEQWVELLDRRVLLLVALRSLADRIAVRRMTLADGEAAIDTEADATTVEKREPRTRSSRELDAQLAGALGRAASLVARARAAHQRAARARSLTRTRSALPYFKTPSPSGGRSLDLAGDDPERGIKQARVAARAPVPAGLRVAIDSQLGRLQGCVPSHLSRDGLWLTAHATLASDGRLRGATVSSQEPVPLAVRSCVVAVLHSVHSQAAGDGGTHRVSLPLVLGGGSR